MTERRCSFEPALLRISDHWTPETAFAVFEIIDELRDAIWAKYGSVIQNKLRCQLGRTKSARILRRTRTKNLKTQHAEP